MADEWWKDFFSGIILDFWKEINSERQTKAEADFIVKRLGVPDGAAILDVPCGEGRLSRELASRDGCRSLHPFFGGGPRPCR